jgi:hypothetical protein
MSPNLLSLSEFDRRTHVDLVFMDLENGKLKQYPVPRETLLQLYPVPRGNFLKTVPGAPGKLS